MSAAGELGLAALAGAGFASAALAAAWAGRAEMRARLAEDLLASRERRASDAVARGNRTRAERGAAIQRERVRQTTAELRAAVAARGPVQDGLGIE